jgi:hypothetical protein
MITALQTAVLDILNNMGNRNQTKTFSQTVYLDCRPSSLLQLSL